jgi:glutaredoxin 3
MLKEYLSQKGIPYLEHDVSRDPAAAQEMINRSEQRGVPVTIIDGQVIVGFDRPRLEQLLSQQQGRPSFGAAIADADKITAGKGMVITSGAYIGRIRPGSTAERMGLTPGDIVVEINQQHITNASDMENILSRLKTGDRISIVYLRDNQTLTTEGAI